MPILNVQVLQGHSVEQRKAFLHAASDAVVSTLSAPVTSVRVTLTELAPENVIAAGVWQAKIVLITVGLIAGRTDEAKAALIRALSDAAAAHLDIDGAGVRVTLFDVPSTDMGMANGVTAKSQGR